MRRISLTALFAPSHPACKADDSAEKFRELSTRFAEVAESEECDEEAPTVCRSSPALAPVLAIG